MGMLSSSVEKIKGFHFEPFPKRVLHNLPKVVLVQHNIYAIGKNGAIYTTGEMSNKVCYCGTGSDYHAVKALHILGLITAEEMRRHGEEKRVRDRHLEMYRAVTCRFDDLAKAGIEMTSAQRRQLAAMKKKIDPRQLPYFLQGEAARKLGLKV